MKVTPIRPDMKDSLEPPEELKGDLIIIASDKHKLDK